VEGTCALVGAYDDSNAFLFQLPKDTQRVTTLPGPPQSVEVRVVDEDTLQVTIAPPLNANITHYKIATVCEGEGIKYNTIANYTFQECYLPACFHMPVQYVFRHFSRNVVAFTFQHRCVIT
jgi:hypothetical protein